MTPAVFAVTNVTVLAGEGVFKAQGKILKFDGHRKMLSPAGKQEDALLPSLSDGMALDLHDLNPTQHFTQPPPRFTEATLIKALEKENIMPKPSTYASDHPDDPGSALRLVEQEGAAVSCATRPPDARPRTPWSSASPRSWTSSSPPAWRPGNRRDRHGQD